MGIEASIKTLAGKFDVPLSIESITSIKSGHINSTYHLKNALPNQPDVILQKVNQQVFENVKHLMENQVLVTEHIQNQEKYRNLVAPLIPTKQGKYWLEYEGEVWRMHIFIKNKKTFETPKSAEICRKAGQTYGTFLKALAEIPAAKIHTHIPDFHNIRFRLRQLDLAVERCDETRIANVESVLSEIENYRQEMCSLFDTATNGGFPIRILHNDTKLSNVLIGTEELGTVIDMDTIMPGFVFYDTGDALRSIAVNTKEDDPNLGAIRMNPDYINAFIDGYVDGTEGILTDLEQKSIPHSGGYMAYIMAVRFLTDYLNGNVYYSISYPEHNVDRANNQLKVCSLFSSLDI
ncbi:MAG: phosphotransferase [Balneolaceae bacterium]|nr:phosphotransferase [Balneolaceae bacterium]